jgi:hypothetical protein
MITQDDYPRPRIVFSVSFIRSVEVLLNTSTNPNNSFYPTIHDKKPIARSFFGPIAAIAPFHSRPTAKLSRATTAAD